MGRQVMAPPPCAEEDAALHRWLALTDEAPLEPELPICDPHHHLWDARAGEGGAHIVDTRPGGPVDPAAQSYGEPNPAGCQQRYLLDDVVADIRSSGHSVTNTCFVECGAMFSKAGPKHLQSLGEVFFAQGAASAAASGTYGTAQICAGITGTLDLSLPDSTLQDALESFVRVPNFRGIRSAPDNAGLAILEKLGVVFETGLGPATAQLAQRFPALKIVVNHCCFRLPKEDDGGKSLREWKSNFATLAPYPNVFAKLGGAGMPSFGFGWADRPAPPSSEEVAMATLPYYGYLLDTLGPSRCMFESNFPVDKLSFSYGVCWNAFKRIAQAKQLTAEDKEWVFSKTACTVYSLDQRNSGADSQAKI